MDEQMEYAEMLEIPVSTIEVKKKRGRKPKKAQNLKEEVISKVNEDNKTTEVKRARKPAASKTETVNPTGATPPLQTQTNNVEEPTITMQTNNPELQNQPIEGAFPSPVIEESLPVAIPRRKKRPYFARMFGKRENEWEYDSIDTPSQKASSKSSSTDPSSADDSSDDSLPIYNYGLYEEEENSAQQRRARRNALIVGIEFAACFALCLGIFLTNVFMPNSAINTFFRSLSDTQQTDTRTYADFKLSSVLSEEDAELTLSPSGILSFQEVGCVYPAVDGSVDTITQNTDGTWTVKISHSDTFSEIISGLSYAACSVGSVVKSNIPVGYSDGNAEVQVSMYEAGALLNCFTLTENGELVWAEE